VDVIAVSIVVDGVVVAVVVAILVVVFDLFFVVVVHVVAVVVDVADVADVAVVVVVVVVVVFVVLVVVRGRWCWQGVMWEKSVATGGSEPMAPLVVLVPSVGIGKCQSLTSSATTVTTRCGGGDTSHFRIGG
jgi:hypothetical protein